MTSCSPIPTVERRRPLLGTTVSIRIDDARDAVSTHAVIDRAFAAIAHVHARMSFHEAGSDLSQLRHAMVGTLVPVDGQTLHVLREAQRLAEASDGAFDVTIAPQLVRRGLLPSPVGVPAPHDHANWRDIAIHDDGVCLRKPLWIDLGGIAKGYAVDTAIAILREAGVARACVNAGGDLRTLGAGPHRVAIDSGIAAPEGCAVLELAEAAVATSTGRAFTHEGPHLDARSGHDTGLDCCATVVADQCMHADALTKVVLALGASSAGILRDYRATAHLQDRAGHWTTLGALQQ